MHISATVAFVERKLYIPTIFICYTRVESVTFLFKSTESYVINASNAKSYIDTPLLHQPQQQNPQHFFLHPTSPSLLYIQPHVLGTRAQHGRAEPEIPAASLPYILYICEFRLMLRGRNAQSHSRISCAIMRDEPCTMMVWFCTRVGCLSSGVVYVCLFVTVNRRNRAAMRLLIYIDSREFIWR